MFSLNKVQSWLLPVLITTQTLYLHSSSYRHINKLRAALSIDFFFFLRDKVLLCTATRRMAVRGGTASRFPTRGGEPRRRFQGKGFPAGAPRPWLSHTLVTYGFRMAGTEVWLLTNTGGAACVCCSRSICCCCWWWSCYCSCCCRCCCCSGWSK